MFSSRFRRRSAYSSDNCRSAGSEVPDLRDEVAQLAHLEEQPVPSKEDQAKTVALHVCTVAAVATEPLVHAHRSRPRVLEDCWFTRRVRSASREPDVVVGRRGLNNRGWERSLARSRKTKHRWFFAHLSRTLQDSMSEGMYTKRV